jgi:transcriptional regulator with GAF, ATPase, and Fis domain
MRSPISAILPKSSTVTDMMHSYRVPGGEEDPGRGRNGFGKRRKHAAGGRVRVLECPDPKGDVHSVSPAGSPLSDDLQQGCGLPSPSLEQPRQQRRVVVRIARRGRRIGTNGLVAGCRQGGVVDSVFDRAKQGAARCMRGRQLGPAGPATLMEQSSAANLRMPATDFDFAELYGSAAALARSMRGEFAPRRFLEAFSSQLRRLIPHDRLVFLHLEENGRTISVFGEHAFAEHTAGDALPHEGHYTIGCDRCGRYASEQIAHASVLAGRPEVVRDYQASFDIAEAEGNRQCPFTGGLRSSVTLPLYGAERVSGALIIGSFAPDVYTESYVKTGQRIAELIGPLVENIVLLHKERHRRRRLTVLPAVARVVGTSLNVHKIFDQLGAVVRPVLDFDLMIARLIGPSGTFQGGDYLHVSDEPEDVAPGYRPEDFSFCSRLLAQEPVLIRDARSELNASLPGDRMTLERGMRSLMVVPLIFGEVVGGVLVFAKRQPDWFDEGDGEVATGIACQVVVAIQHQRLAEEQHRLAAVEERTRQLERRVERLRGALTEQYRFDSIIGQAPVFREALDQAALVAPEETAVLLTGESGTGKELVARAIHYASRRAEGPFVAVNCAALPETLVESELFGHERGAFTGADKLKRGRFELAAGGTLFLDEIGELAPSVQAKLLRVLQERQYERVGGTATLKADVRLVTATNRDLEQVVGDGRFRVDLYYRLAVFRIHLPALRDRKDDVLLLADHFLRELAERMGRSKAGLSEQARQLLRVHHWPGNIRELQNAIERALILADGELISGGHLGIVGHFPTAADIASRPTAGESSAPLTQPLAEVEKQSVLAALRRAKGNKSLAAAALGLSRGALYTRLRRFGLIA